MADVDGAAARGKIWLLEDVVLYRDAEVRQGSAEVSAPADEAFALGDAVYGC